MSNQLTPHSLDRTDTFPARHLGPRPSEMDEMLRVVRAESLDALCAQTIPASILRDGTSQSLGLPGPRTEESVLAELRAMAELNQVFRSFIGTGYSDTHTPPVIQRHILENPGWYTQYTAYQAEISQGRLEMLLNFQTMVADLTGLPLANASLLDEATAAAEAMTLCHNAAKSKSNRFFVATDCHPQTCAVVATRAEPQGIEVVYGHPNELDSLADLDAPDSYFGILLQYPTTDGRVFDYRSLIERAHAQGAMVVMATDLLALTRMAPPGELRADVAIGSAQRFGVPLGFGGPHAAFMSTKDEFKRLLPGRIVGISKDSANNPAYRLALQTREQHIRRDKATSNICTAQALLAVISAAYAMYHGPEGLRAIADRVHAQARTLAAGLRMLGLDAGKTPYFDTLRVKVADDQQAKIAHAAYARRMNVRLISDSTILVALDETTTGDEVAGILEAFAAGMSKAAPSLEQCLREAVHEPDLEDGLLRRSAYLEHEVFHRYRSEHELLRYLHKLQSRDLSLTTSMIPLGSCTMKLNAAAEMMALSWPGFASLHPFAPREQATGYFELFTKLEHALAEITGFAATSLQPNAGAQGEYASLLLIRKYHQSRGEAHRKVCLIPVSAHGTNPASAVMAGMKVVAVACDERGNIDLADLRKQANTHADNLSACMITYPSTHGVFEETIVEACRIVHEAGGQVFLDGANMNAQVGLCRPGDFGADVCHLNLHKTFCIPHGGGGPGMGPICVAKHLKDYLPSHPVTDTLRENAVGAVSAAPYGSASILTISYAYIAMMGGEGLRKASQVAILNANYMAQRLSEHFKILYRGVHGRVAHEFIVDVRPFKASADISADDIAKRLMDYSFHAPTMSWPVAGTLMIEPTESESKAELDRFCDAMIAIRQEIRDIETGKLDREVNPLRMSPHTMPVVISSEWDRPYTREQAAFPLPYLRDHKFWPFVGRVDNAYGDRNLVCTCVPMEAYAEV